MSFYKISCRRADGFAIGPILFVVAILGIIAAAIAASTGGFNSRTSSEAARVKAAALIDLGYSLKSGFEHTVHNVVYQNLVVINPDSTSNDNDIFSPNGGGIGIPSVTMANNPANDQWYYVDGAIPGLGTSETEKIAMLRVANDVCEQVNQKASGVTTPNAADIGNVVSNTLGSNSNNWPGTLQFKPTGCINNSNSGASGWWFYQVMGLQ